MKDKFMKINTEELIQDFLSKNLDNKFVNHEERVLQIPGTQYHIHLEDLFATDKALVEIVVVLKIFEILNIQGSKIFETDMMERFLKCCSTIYDLYNDEDLLQVVEENFKNSHPKEKLN